MNAVISEADSHNVAELKAAGPGDRLKAARVSLGYDISKLAEQIHLTSTMVESLERDDYDDMPARVFVRGYLTNYARVVGLPPESILRQFDEKWPPQDGHSVAMPSSSPRLPTDSKSSRGWASFFTWVILLAIIALFAMWWRGYLDDIVPGATDVWSGERADTVEPAPEEAGDTLQLGQPAELISGDGSLALPPVPVAAVTSEKETPAAESVAAVAELTVADTATQAVAEKSAPEAVATAVAADPVVGNAVPAAAVAKPVKPAVVAEPLDSKVEFEFTAPCWVDIRDSSRKFKLFGEMPKGARRSLGGTPPYKVVIGNATSVKISIGGKPFDLGPYIKGNVARFTLRP